MQLSIPSLFSAAVIFFGVVNTVAASAIPYNSPASAEPPSSGTFRRESPSTAKNVVSLPDKLLDLRG
ncbi:hypothetical protein BC835DRAFT_1394993 [Cytidiella melzeri]|nr:hypothetical protein BC835DRAFT_1394993 [Cytidiella melzeri]